MSDLDRASHDQFNAQVVVILVVTGVSPVELLLARTILESGAGRG